jgi:hypothetical protein
VLELYKNHEIHPIIPFVEVISPHFAVYYVDPDDASALYGTIKSRTGVRHGDPLGPLLFKLAIIIPLQKISECRETLP